MSGSLSQLAGTVNLYFQGMHRADLGQLRKAFHPSACIRGIRDGRLWIYSCDEFLARVRDVGDRAAAGEPFDMELISVDKSGPVAVAKAVDLWNGHRYIDYLAIANCGDDWVIVDKLFVSPGEAPG